MTLHELIDKLSEIRLMHGGDLPVTATCVDAEVRSVKLLDDIGAEWEPGADATEIFLES